MRMFQLNEQQVDVVYARLHKEGLKSVKLEQDLLDHFCCHMEEQMQRGEDFESAYRNAIAAIFPNGAKEIEYELFFIMNFNKQVSMKKLIFITGFTATFLISTGFMFKTLHWFAGQMLLFAGFAILLLAMVIIAIHAARFMRNKPSSFWVRTAAGTVSLALIATGVIFKTLYFPGANMLYGLGTIILNFVFLPLFFYHLYKYGFVKTQADETI